MLLKRSVRKGMLIPPKIRILIELEAGIASSVRSRRIGVGN